MLCCTWFRGIWAGPPHQSLITPTRFIPCPGHEAVELRGHGNHQLQRGCWKLGQQIWAWRSLQKRPVQQLWGAALPCAWHPSQGLGRQGLAHPARIQVLWLWNHTLGLQTHHGSFLNLRSTAWKKRWMRCSLESFFFNVSDWGFLPGLGLNVSWRHSNGV